MKKIRIIYIVIFSLPLLSFDKVSNSAESSVRISENLFEEDVLLSVSSGQITDCKTGKPIPGANIQIMGTSTGTQSDFEGRFTISPVENGTVLQISFIGYETLEIELSVIVSCPGAICAFSIPISESCLAPVQF